MVQLAVLLPILEYQNWSNHESYTIVNDLKNNLSSFYDDELKTIVRWLPAAANRLDESEEQKVEGVIDSWYLHHPLLNLSRLALLGNKNAKELFLVSLAFAQKVARHFKYEWPVFYKMDTLEIVKEETQPGEGGEKDVAGIYSLVMLQAYELTKEEKYLKEAERAAKSLEKFGFNIFYQANNTAFSAGAMLRLYKITKNPKYKQLNYLFIANLFKNISLWTCNYGYGKNFPTFFGLFPLNDAPYYAVYEESEVFAALHDYLLLSYKEDILPAFSTLLAEFIKHKINRAVYYYPPMLPKEMLATEIKTGELDPNLWVPLEDIHDGWEESGSVGQEVYGTGLGFGVVPRQYIKIKNENFLVFLDYPFSKPVRRMKYLTFYVFGSDELTFRLLILKSESKKLPANIIITCNKQGEMNGTPTKNGDIEYLLKGNQKVKITW